MSSNLYLCSLHFDDISLLSNNYANSFFETEVVKIQGNQYGRLTDNEKKACSNILRNEPTLDEINDCDRDLVSEVSIQHIIKKFKKEKNRNHHGSSMPILFWVELQIQKDSYNLWRYNKSE